MVCPAPPLLTSCIFLLNLPLIKSSSVALIKSAVGTQCYSVLGGNLHRVFSGESQHALWLIRACKGQCICLLSRCNCSRKCELTTGEKALCESRETVLLGICSPCQLITTLLWGAYISVAYIVPVLITLICLFDKQTKIITGRRISKWKILFGRDREELDGTTTLHGDSVEMQL